MPLPTPIVLTNDDGIEAAGLNHLAAALQPLAGGDLYVVAPDRCYSACSQQVTMRGPIAVTPAGPRRYAIGGSPADCVRLALTHLVPRCGLVISGINHGGNMGHDIMLSGTVGAAREGAILGTPAIAISQYFHGQPEVDWEQAAARAVRAIAALGAFSPREEGPAPLWNINLPHVGDSPDETPITFCEPCTAALPVAYTERDGHFTYDGSRYHSRVQTPGTDVSACFGGAIAISRLATASAAPAADCGAPE